MCVCIEKYGKWQVDGWKVARWVKVKGHTILKSQNEW